MHLALAGFWQDAVVCLVANVVHAVASERCALHPAAAWASLDLPLNNFDKEDDEIQHEDDEPQNDVRQAAFDNADEVQKSALHPRLQR